MAVRAGERVHRQPRKFFEGLSEALLEFAREHFARPEINAPPCLDYLWRWFLDITYDRENGMGFGYIRSSEYVAWEKLNRLKISISELGVLKMLDRALVDFKNGDDGKPRERKSLFAQLADLKKESP
jgi:hypothetical protein